MPRTRTRLTERRNKNQFNSSNVSNKATTNTINYKKKSTSNKVDNKWSCWR